MPTQSDVAKLAGVSTTTVSIIINGHAGERRISRETTQRVQRAMEQLRYVPNQAARLLRSHGNPPPVIGLCWPLEYRPDLLGPRLLHLRNILQEEDPGCRLSVHPYASGHLEDCLEPVLCRQYAGILLEAPDRRDLEQLERQEIPVPVLLLNRESDRWSSVGVRNDRLGAVAADLLVRKGCRSCAVIRTEGRSARLSDRIAAFLEVCGANGIPVPADRIFSGPDTIAGGARAAERCLQAENRPAVLFCESDRMAQGCLWALQNRGVRIPEDVELLCVGEQSPEDMEFFHPPVSCVSVPPELDRTILTTMLRLLRERPETPIRVTLEPQVQLHGSFQI